ncbi:hypothetical protein SUGI_0601130 [Cryptomeria japonica]|uniref:uncharacterized protein LOC131033246 isoform X1 n=1 Tax=Cryptomeria japonica TaxID=3369 RepID=UPI002414A8D6|nr:uncharacterized protein LOC131033246 isoform X1 [Cryptomeria japonica]GLJ30385.1 hypothetical protein SUGI_0601130 [Cryptomeria japonica]
MGEQEQHAFPWLNTLVTEPFYAFHALTFFSYIVIRHSASEWLSDGFSHHLFRREIQALLTFGVLVALKMVKSKTWESFIADSMLYAKGILIMLASILERRLAVWYIVVFIVIFLLFQQPHYSGQGYTIYLTPLQLESILTEGSNSELWLVEFRALWSSRCVQASRVLSDLSLMYSSKNLSFGLVDLGRFPNAGSKFGITLGANMGQLPTYILFENGAEVSRIPEMDLEGKVKTPTITKRLLAQHFELDRRLIEFLSNRSSHANIKATKPS